MIFLKGSALAIDGQSVEVKSAIEVNCSVPVELVNGSREAEILMLQGRPIGEPVVLHGPFVMNSEDEIGQAYTDYRTTQFGGWAWASNDPNHGPAKGRFAST